MANMTGMATLIRWIYYYNLPAFVFKNVMSTITVVRSDLFSIPVDTHACLKAASIINVCVCRWLHQKPISS